MRIDNPKIWIVAHHESVSVSGWGLVAIEGNHTGIRMHHLHVTARCDVESGSLRISIAIGFV